jgi:DNA-binding MarR family transcriptional regulator
MIAVTPPHDQPPSGLAGVDPASQGAVLALMRTMQLQRQLLGKLLAEMGKPDTHPAQAMCLRALAANDGISQRDLAEKLHVSRPTVTTMLQRMEHCGAIERHVDPNDQRLTRVHLTPAGRQLEADMRVVFAAYVRQTFALLPEQDRRELERILRTVCEHAVRALDETAAPNANGAAPEGGSDQ